MAGAISLILVAATTTLGGLGMLICGPLLAKWKWAMRGAGLFLIGIVIVPVMALFISLLT